MLTSEEKDKIKELNSKNSYGLSKNQLVSLIRKHKKARAEEDTKTMESIEYRLTDINFHSECGLIMRGDYKEANKVAKEMFWG